MIRVCNPPMARAAATLTAEVVLPTPPFWLATVKIRVEMGWGMGSRNRLVPTTLRGADVSRESVTRDS